MFDLHRHDEYSTFDGFGRADDLAKLAKELGYNSLSSTNHGNTNGLVQTYRACKKYELKAILGCEGYFLPKWKEKTRGFHLILIAKNLQGFHNLNELQYEGEKIKYYNPIWTFELLEKFHEGLICTTACVQGYLAQCIIKGKMNVAESYLKKMVDIFGEDFYVEIQPYKISDVGVQEKVNIESIKLAKKLGIKCILTSDSHRGRKDDLDSYIKMHEIAGHDVEHIKETYAERYMPEPDEMRKRFYKMHKDDFGEKETKKLAKEMYDALDEIEEKCEMNYLDNLKEILPKMQGVKDTYKVLENKVKEGLKDRGVWNKKYIERAKEELDVIKYHGFEDYFLMVWDYVNWAKSNGIEVGPGRGSACNSIVCYALHITEVDSIHFDLEFRRFLMKERKKMPDIDLDFETARRGEVIDYILQKYPGQSAQICSYGLYKVDNLVNDLAKVCGLPTDKSVGKEETKINKGIIADIKTYLKQYIEEGYFDEEGAMADKRYKQYNEAYDGIIKHFCRMYLKVRYIGTHAAGVAVTGANIFDYTAVRIDAKSGRMFASYDLQDIEHIGCIKFDILGLKTMSELKECHKYTGIPTFDISMTEDRPTIEAFGRGDCNGVFQMNEGGVQQILVNIHTDCFNDIVAATAMNRPGPLKQRMPERYAANKEAEAQGEQGDRMPAFDKYLQKTYGTIIYQEQIMRMCVEIAGMTWDEAHATTKMKAGVSTPTFLKYFKEEYPKFEDQFAKGAAKLGVPDKEAREQFHKLYEYSFNEGHSVGYALVSLEQMYYKVHYPDIFWYSKIKFANNEADYSKFCESAVGDGAAVFLPHVNYSKVKCSLRKIDGEYAIQQGLTSIKGVGEVAAKAICLERKENGIFRDYDDFLDRIQGKKVNKRVVELLLEYGALDFNKKLYISKVKKYNSALYARAERYKSKNK